MPKATVIICDSKEHLHCLVVTKTEVYDHLRYGMTLRALGDTRASWCRSLELTLKQHNILSHHQEEQHKISLLLTMYHVTDLTL